MVFREKNTTTNAITSSATRPTAIRKIHFIMTLVHFHYQRHQPASQPGPHHTTGRSLADFGNQIKPKGRNRRTSSDIFLPLSEDKREYARISEDFPLEPALKFAGGLFSWKRPDGEARRRRISLVDRRLRSNEARRPFPRKPCGRRVFCPWPALARSLQPAAEMLGTRRLGHSQNPSPQRPS